MQNIVSARIHDGRPMRARLTASFACALLTTVAYAQADLEIVLYAAYGTGSKALVEGRVITREDRSEPALDDDRSRNLARTMRALVNEEHADVPVTVGIGGSSWTARSDREGYFRLLIDDLPAVGAGWNTVNATAPGGVGTGSLLMIPAQNVHGLISDVDDTVLVSDVNDKSRLLANSLLLNHLQREPVEGVPPAYRTLLARNADAGAAPLFYLSASPRQIQSGIQSFLDHHDFPRGVLITKRVTNDASSEPLENQFAYKIGKLVEVFERLPHVSFVLVGDDGEQDPEVYETLRRRYGARVSAIWIRRVNPDPDRPRIAGQGDLADLLRSADGSREPPGVVSSDEAP